MAQALKIYNAFLEPSAFARNGDVPDSKLWALLERRLNHGMAWARKVVFSVGGDFGSGTDVGTSSSTVEYWRAHCRTGCGATELRFRIVAGNVFGEPPPEEPVIGVSVKPTGGAKVDYLIEYGATSDEGGATPNDDPHTLGHFLVRAPVSALTSYEILVAGTNGGRPLCVLAYEYADPEIDSATEHYSEHAPTAESPIYDSTRQKLVEGFSEMWNAGGAHLLTWAGTGNGDPVEITGTTWTNLLDGTSTSVGNATPGYFFDNEADGSNELQTLLPLVRIKDGNDLPITLAVYAETDAGSTGEVRLQGSGGTHASITGITTSLAWHTVDTTLTNVDTITKLDLQLRNGTAGQTTSVYAVSCYVRAGS